MDGTPREVFSHAGELEEMGLAVPQVTSVFLRLRELGLPVDTSVYTTAQAKAALMALKGGRGCCSRILPLVSTSPGTPPSTGWTPAPRS